MRTLHISILDKKANYASRDGDIVCGNSDYVIEFSFDAEWEAYEQKTARFIVNGQYKNVDFTGTTCPVPIITNATVVQVGVYAGDLSTTTPAIIACQKSILCESAAPGGNPTLNGDNAFIRYSASADGTDFTEEWSQGQDYIGFATGQSAPTDKSGYEWLLFKGEDGDQVFIRYSASADGTGFTESWNTSQRYIGFAVAKTAPTNKSAYKWSLFAPDITAITVETLPDNCITYDHLDGALKQCVNPITNLIINGNGKNGTTGWANSNGSTVEAIEDGVKYSQASATSAAYLDVTFCKITDMEAVSAGDILFQYADMMADGVAPTTLRLAIENRNATECTVRVDHPTTDTWYQMYRRHTVTESQISDNSLNPRLFAEWSTSADRKASCVYVKNAIIINLTKTYGAGNEPSNEEMLALIQANGGYIDGTLNLFDAKTMMERQATVEGRVGDLEDRVDELGDGLPADVEERMSALEGSVPSRLVRNLAYKVVSGTKTGGGGSAEITGVGQMISNTSGGYATAFTKGHLYYAHCNISIDSDCEIIVRFGTNNGAWGIKTLSVEANKVYPVSLCYLGDGDISWKWQVAFASAEDQNGKTLTCTKIFLCDLTELFGEGDEPPASYMDKLVNYGDLNLATEHVNLMNGGAVGDTCTRRLRGSKESLYLDDQNGVPYVETTDEGNVVISSKPNYAWSNWSKQAYKYGMTAVRNTPIYNYVHGVLETDAMFSVQALYGRWTQNATNGTGAHPYGGHVFEAWNAPRTYRYTVLIGKNEETEACAFTFSPLSGGGGGNFGTLRLGSDITGQGLLVGQKTAEMGGDFTVNGKLNVKQRTISSSSAEGVAGEICFDNNYVYCCVAENTWKRFALSTW